MVQFCIRMLVALSLVGVLQLAPAAVQAAPAAQDGLPNIVETAVSAGNFTTLVAALQAAGLDETLAGEGPFTVFAPTDEAFAALPAGTVESLLEDPSGALTDVLLYHVVAGTVTAVDAVNAIGGSLEMANGQTTTLSVEGNRLLLNNAGFVAMNVETANGVIHVIDQVLIPSMPVASEEAAEEEATAEEPAAEAEAAEETTAEAEATAEPAAEDDMAEETAAADIVDTAIAAGTFETLVAAVDAAGLVETLKGEGPFTVFAPTDEAFAALPEGTVEGLLADPSGALTDILLYHVVPGQVLAADVVGLDGQSVETVGGAAVMITVAGDVVMIDDAQVVTPDIVTSNGVIHVIDTVLIPTSDEAADGAAEDASEADASGDAESGEATAAEEMEGEMADDGEAMADDSAAETDATAACADTYHVQRGDTLSQIAADYGVNIQTLLRSNQIRNANYIYPGQAICIPN